MSFSTILALMSEVGPEGIKKFKTGKHFASWLRIAPNNKVSGGKLLSSKVPKGSNRLKIALRNVANLPEVGRCDRKHKGINSSEGLLPKN